MQEILPTEMTMKPKTFISYSRQCIGFVDDLFHKLEKHGFNDIWLDYLSLVPGRPWNGQIDKGLEEAELLLLVVSPESISSRSVVNLSGSTPAARTEST